MKNKIMILVLIGFLISCSNNYDTNETFEINGRFTRLITGCDFVRNTEINCYEFVEFTDDSTVDVLIGGGDIVFRTSFIVNNKTIEFKKIEGLNFNISFIIQDETTLTRIEDGKIWQKDP